MKKLIVSEMVQVYAAVCLLIGMNGDHSLGEERPDVSDLPALVAARDKLRKALEACGHFRMSDG